MMIYLQMIDSPEDRSKFEQIYIEYRDLMFYIANRILNNQQDAEDVVHEAFLKVAEHIEKIGDPKCSKTKSFIVIVVENKAIDLYRKRSRHPNVELNDEVQSESVTYECENILTECIMKLPARYREVILLHYYHGYSRKEIAKILGLSYGATSQLELRAKKRLMELYEREV